MSARAAERSPALASIGAVALAFVAVPVAALALGVPWQSFGSIVTSPFALNALRLSAIVSVVATGICLILGLPLAWLLARDRFGHFTRIVRALVIVPLLLPPVVAGVALLAAFGRRGLVGGWIYDLTGAQLPFTTAGVVLATTFVSLPFLVITLEGAFRSLDRNVLEAAAVDGASPAMVFARIAVPIAAPSLLAGTLLAWARALGEFGATITFAGNLEGVTQTMPLAVYTALESDRDVALAMSALLLGVALAILVALRGNYLPRRTAPAQG